MSGRRPARLPRAALVLALGLAPGLGACAYDPLVGGDHTSAAYKGDLAACETATSNAVGKDLDKRFRTWLSYPVAYPIRYRSEIKQCMVAKGYPAQG